MTATDIKTLLDSIGKDRHWLAGELGVSKATIDDWCRTGGKIPPWAERMIPMVVQEFAMGSAKFSPAEWEKIQRAMKARHYDNIVDYIVDSTIRVAEEESSKYGEAPEK